jgi:hypothetical protein
MRLDLFTARDRFPLPHTFRSLLQYFSVVFGPYRCCISPMHMASRVNIKTRYLLAILLHIHDGNQFITSSWPKKNKNDHEMANEWY